MNKNGKDFWGDSVWKAIHTFAAAYKPENELEFRAYIYSLTKLLPCESCREHLKRHLEKYPMDTYMRNNHDLFFWTYTLHHAVNESYNRDHPTSPHKRSPPYDVVKNMYWKALGETCSDCKTY